MKKFDALKIFLIDDDIIFSKLLKIELLEIADFNIETYHSGELCIENLRHKPDVIILDYHLQCVDTNVMNGIQTLDKITALNNEIPVVMLSSYDDIDIVLDSLEHKAFDYITKKDNQFIRLKTIINSFLLKKKAEKVSWVVL